MARSRPRRSTRRVVAVLAAACVALLGLPVAGPAAAAPPATVVSADSGLCLDVRRAVRAPGTPVIMWPCHGRANQRWSLDSAGRLLTLDGGLCLAAARNERGAAAVTADCSGNADQRWRHAGDQTLRHVESGRCLDVAGGDEDALTPVVLWPCHAGANQRWSAPPRLDDTTPPSAPERLASRDLTCRTVVLTWTASSDDVAVTEYDVFHDGQLVRSVPASTLSVEMEVRPGVAWGWYVNARDAAENISQASPTVQVVPPPCEVDTTPPTVPTGVRATAQGTAVTLRWTAAEDDVRVTAYDVLRDGTRVGRVTSGASGVPTSFTDSGLRPDRTYTYTLVARDAQGNESRPSEPVRVGTGSDCDGDICDVREVARDGDVPWGLVTLPDGTVLYGRRDAHDVVLLDPATGAKRSVGTVPGVRSTDGEGGLMGLAIGRDFARDRWLYVMHSTATDNRVVRIPYSTDGRLVPAQTQVLLAGILRNKYHNGGRLRFGPDGMLYVATGDAQNGAYAQALTGVGALNGKILRITPSGGIPGDNPFGTAVWSYGHRNPQGLAFDEAGRLWEQEFGNDRQDETNLVVRGGNHGWPQCEGTVSRSGAGCGAPGLVAPAATYSTVEGSCSGIAVVGDALWVACARGARLYRQEIDGNRLRDTEQFLVGTYGRLRTVEPAPGGGLWLTTTNRGDKDSVPGNSDERVLHLTLDD